jgi:hypothetical protein
MSDAPADRQSDSPAAPEPPALEMPIQPQLRCTWEPVQKIGPPRTGTTWHGHGDRETELVYLRVNHREFTSLAGRRERFEVLDKDKKPGRVKFKSWRVVSDEGDEIHLVQFLASGRFVLVDIPLFGPARPAKEIEPGAASYWYKHFFPFNCLPDGFTDHQHDEGLDGWLGSEYREPPGINSPESSTYWLPTVPQAATAPTPAARPTHEDERESEAPAAGPIETAVPGAQERQSETPTFPVEQAAQMIGDSTRGAELLRYLNRQRDRKASLTKIAVDLDGAREETANRREGTIRQRFNRTREALERKGAPVRLHIANGVIELVVPEAPPGHTTPM